MLEGIVQIGRALLENKSLIDNLIKNLPTEDKKGNHYHVLKLKFSEENLELDVSEEMDSDSARKYLYVGTAEPNAPQWFATNNKIKYFLSETLFNLANNNIDFGEPLNQKLKHIFDKFYIDLDSNIKNKKYRYALDLSYLDPSVNVKKLYEEYSKQKKGDDKEFLKVLEKEFEKILSKKYQARLSEFGLFVIYIDGEPLSKHEEYRKKVLEYKSSSEKNEKGSKKWNSKDLRCNICGSTENLTYDLRKMKIKYYINDKITFASEFDKDKFYKNMVICQNCLNAILAAETYLDNKLKTKLGDLDLYIFPHFIYGDPLNERELDLVADKVINSYNIVKNLKGVEEFEKSFLDDEDRYFLVNFMFFKKSQQATKIRKFIKDVPPYIFEKIAKASKDAHEIVEKAIQMNYKTYIDLQKIYYLIPIKVSEGKVIDYKYILDFYESLLTFKPIEKETLIDKFVEATKVIYLQKNGYNIKKDLLEFYIFNANMLLKFLEKMENLKGGSTLDTSELKVKEDIKNYISTMGYDEQQSAMFLLGVLIGEIGNSQYRKYNNDKKPILNKLNFNGIDRSKIIKLANEVYAKLEQEKIRKYHEVTYAEMKRLLDENIKNWRLNKNENLFYILSGYSYATIKIIMKEESENEWKRKHQS